MIPIDPTKKNLYITMLCSCHSDRLFVDQVKWKEPLILSLDFDK